MIRIRSPRVRYHRNGVHGIGFYAVTFRAEGRRMVASVFPFDEALTMAEHYAVLDLDNPIQPYRGDLYEPALMEAIRSAAASGEAYRYSVPELAEAAS